MLWQLQFNPHESITKIALEKNFREYIVKYLEEEKEQGLAANIQCELIEFFFYHVQDNSIFDDFIPYIEKEKVLSKIEYEIFRRKPIS